jgi:hypothetical protein
VPESFEGKEDKITCVISTLGKKVIPMTALIRQSLLVHYKYPGERYGAICILKKRGMFFN